MSDGEMYEASYSLLLPFDRDLSECEEEFCMGFECGRLWTLAQDREEEFTEGCHVVNGEMLLRIGESLGRTVTWEETRDGHAFVTFHSEGSEGAT